MSGKEVVEKLISHGWVVKSREEMQVKLSNGNRIVIVPIQNGGPLNPGLLHAIEKQTGVRLL